MSNTSMTDKQMELWDLANAELRKIGGPGGINRNPDPAIRERGKTEGTREWALLQSVRLVSGHIGDDECQRLVDIIRGGGTR